MRLVQIVRNGERRVGIVDDFRLRLVEQSFPSVYDLGWKALRESISLEQSVSNAVSGDSFDYEAVYAGRSEWRFLPSFDHPSEPARCLVSGTGLTHNASAKNRAAMHVKGDAEATDSYRMFQMGLEGGSPAPGEVGVQPEWFYKGDGSVLKGHLDALTVPRYGDDGGEEPEIAGAYIISPNGEPFRVGLSMANEFSDHVMEKKNYLYLAPSKLRECSLGPELAIGDVPFEHVPGTVSIVRDGAMVWSSDIWTGQKNMSHSVANLEHHHFKYAAHRRPGDVHIHFFGADAFSFGAGVTLKAHDLMEVSFPQFGRPLRNYLEIDSEPETAVRVKHL
ncbi:MAG TPA: AraD1 family protein [Bryobacteraceae bacterium]|nr:AraD1 family protein [Bryobacteraceae bacterium]